MDHECQCCEDGKLESLDLFGPEATHATYALTDMMYGCWGVVACADSSHTSFRGSAHMGNERNDKLDLDPCRTKPLETEESKRQGTSVYVPGYAQGNLIADVQVSRDKWRKNGQAPQH